jgi:ribokinase
LLATTPGGGHVLITLGDRGALLVGEEGPLWVPAATVAAVDTVGAGDTLNGALAAGLASGLSVSEAARQAVAAASLATTRAGAREGMPTARELEAFLGGRTRSQWASTPMAPTQTENR